MDYADQPGRTNKEADAGAALDADHLQHLGTDYRDDAQELIRLLGGVGQQLINPGIWLYVGPALDWPNWIFAGTGISKDSALPDKITVAQDLVVAANLLSNLDREQIFGLILAHPFSTLGPFAQLMAGSAPTLKDAVGMLVFFFNEQNPLLCIRLEESEKELALVVEPRLPLGGLQEFFTVGALIALYQFVMANGRRPDEVRIETTLRWAVHKLTWDALKCDVTGDATRVRLIMAEAMASQPNPRNDPELWQLVEGSCSRLETATEPVADEKRIRALIRHSLRTSGSVPRLKHVAAEARVSERSLIRALQRQQTSFHAMVDEERRSAALLLIQNPQTPLTDLARALGFSSQSSFGRTFKSWTGVSPGEHRKRVQWKS
jgi:AraC-like DNA-binding protein